MNLVILDAGYHLTLAAPEVDGIVIHPAMVYAADGGVFHRFAREAVGRDAIRVVGSEDVRWPLVHSEDLANIYLWRWSKPLRDRTISARRPTGWPSDASRAPSPGASARLARCRKSFLPMR